MRLQASHGFSPISIYDGRSDLLTPGPYLVSPAPRGAADDMLVALI